MRLGRWLAEGSCVRRWLSLTLVHASLLPALALAQQSAPAPASNIPQTPAATLIGTVKDVNGDVIPAAAVAVKAGSGSSQYSATANSNGFFTLSVSPGTYTVVISAPGLVPWKTNVSVQPGAYEEISGIVLGIRSVVSTVRVNASQHSIAAQQVKLEEQQRILGAIPNFYVSYIPDAAPLSVKQKYSLAWRYSIDPVNFIIVGVTAGIEQAENTFPGYGQGAAGYGKRFGAAFADDTISNIVGGAVLPALLHQDPRFYFRSGRVAARIRYSLETVFICKGDNGRWEPNYSFIGGNFVSGAISNLYYPRQDRGMVTTIDNALVTTAMGAVGSLAQEFLLKHFTHGGEAGASSGP